LATPASAPPAAGRLFSLSAITAKDSSCPSLA
jgi:hypothetical protein